MGNEKINTEYPRVLVISHTSFTKSNSMGSTLASYFTTYDPDCMAQFYIKDMTPDIPVCKHYYCTTDKDLVNKLRHPLKGKVGKSIELCVDGDETPGKTAVASAAGAHRHRDIALLARKALWSTRLWNNRAFKEWVRDFDPQVILVQPGDFSYLLDMGVALAKKMRLPIVVHQSESYYLKDYEKRTPLYQWFRYDFKKSYERLMAHTSFCVYLCEALERGYNRFFSVPSATIMKATNLVPKINERTLDKNNIRLIYGGNLGETVGRCEPLLQLGQAAKALGAHIDVYTSSTGEHMKDLTSENGIVLHGALPYDELQKEIKNSDFVLYPESQRPWNVKDLEYAFSTKIADMLASGVCSVVYGSAKIAGIQYFKEHALGCVIEKQEDIQPLLRELISNDKLRSGYIENALSQAKKEHSPTLNSECMRKVICKAYEKGYCGR